MKIAIDIDDTLSITFQRWVQEFQNRGYDVHNNDWSPGRSFGGTPTPQEVKDMYAEKRAEFRSSYEHYPGAPAITNILKHDMVAITGRITPEEQCPYTMQWLRTKKIPITKVIHSQDKATACKEEQVDVLIEDDPRYAIPVLEAGIPVLLRDQHYNQDLEHPLITRFTHWLEVPLLLKKLSRRET